MKREARKSTLGRRLVTKAGKRNRKMVRKGRTIRFLNNRSSRRNKREIPITKIMVKAI
jgi:hypothetical protein